MDAMPTRVCRLAPSPTGHLHLGNARTFLIAWLSARKSNAKLILRIEDIDTPRVRPEYVDSQLADLKWLGLGWDEGPVFQSQRLQLYRDALEQLKKLEAVYPCTCTRKEIEQSASAPHADSEGPAYPGTCSQHSAKDAEALGKRPYCWRFRFDRAPAFDDLFRGPMIRLDAKAIGGDFVVWRGEMPSYQLAVVVDDALMGVTEVIRGDDLISSTPRQLALFEMLGFEAPRFGHVPLVFDEKGQRMAKRNDSTRLSNLREAGVSAETVIGRLAHSSGWMEREKRISARELLSFYDPSKVPLATVAIDRIP